MRQRRQIDGGEGGRGEGLDRRRDGEMKEVKVGREKQADGEEGSYESRWRRRTGCTRGRFLFTPVLIPEYEWSICAPRSSSQDGQTSARDKHVFITRCTRRLQSALIQ